MILHDIVSTVKELRHYLLFFNYGLITTQPRTKVCIHGNDLSKHRAHGTPVSLMDAAVMIEVHGSDVMAYEIGPCAALSPEAMMTPSTS